MTFFVRAGNLTPILYVPYCMINLVIPELRYDNGCNESVETGYITLSACCVCVCCEIYAFNRDTTEIKCLRIHFLQLVFFIVW